jgi:tetratricopeptide (TPR) repeat protein
MHEHPRVRIPRVALRACVVLAVAGSTVATAAEIRPTQLQAMAAQNAGVRAFDEGRLEEAIVDFEEAYRLSSQPVLLYELGEARYQLRNFEAAKSCLFEFLEKERKSPLAQRAFHLLTRIDAETGGAPATVMCVGPEQQKRVALPQDRVKPPSPAPPPPPPPPRPVVAEARPFYKSWWFWTAVGVVAVGGGTVIALTAGGGGPPSTHLGTVPVFP